MALSSLCGCVIYVMQSKENFGRTNPMWGERALAHRIYLARRHTVSALRPLPRRSLLTTAAAAAGAAIAVFGRRGDDAAGVGHFVVRVLPLCNHCSFKISYRTFHP